MKRQSLILKLIFAAVCILCAAFTAVTFLYARSIFVPCAVFSGAVLFLGALLMHRSYVYTESVMAQLSQMIASISSLGSMPVVAEYEDSLLSKLQSQTVQLTEMLLEQNRLVEKEKNEINSLVSDISHQLKTPVASLRAYGELILESGDEDAREEYLQAFSCALERLTFLTESMVKLSRLEGGIISVKPEQLSLNDTVLGAVKQVYRKASDKGVEIVFDSDRVCVTLPHDGKWTQEAIFNILDNAVKYTHCGGKITLELSAMEMFARLDVSDTGIGIEPHELPKIFGRFYRGENSAGEEGVGIGLYLARKIVTDQGGYIKVSSSQTGSVFSVFLPL